MAKMTLLEIVQNILSAMESDYANSIGDSVESAEVADVVKETYFDLINNVLDVPEHKQLINLTGLGDTSHPNYLKLADNVKKIDWFKYNKETADDPDQNYQSVDYIAPEDFIIKTNGRRESDTNIVLINDFGAGQLLIQNDKHPEFWTSFDDLYIVCDSFRTASDNTLQQSKSLCWGSLEPSWTVSDSFVPDLDSHLFPLLLEEAKATCFTNFKQVSNVKSEQRARRQLTHIHNKKHRIPIDRHARQPNYGRK
jgi:hypothetical protein